MLPEGREGNRLASASDINGFGIACWGWRHGITRYNQAISVAPETVLVIRNIAFR